MDLRTSLYISAGILFLGLIIFSLFIYYGRKKKAEAIAHYEKIRDKLTTREKERYEEIKDSGTFNLGNLIGGFVAVLIGVTLIPEVSKAVAEAGTSVNSPLLALIPIFFTIGVFIIGIGVAINGFKSAGLV